VFLRVLTYTRGGEVTEVQVLDELTCGRSGNSSQINMERAEAVYSYRSMLWKISVPRSSSLFLDPVDPGTR
jgi:hypothetical protein